MPQPSSLPAVTADASAVALTAPPAHLNGLLDETGVARFENLPSYDGLVAALAESLAPTDAVDWILVKDLADLIWEMRRLRTAKAAVLTITRPSVVRHLSEHFSTADSEDAPLVAGQAYYRRLADMERLDRMLTITGVRRDTVLRELEQRRMRRAAGPKA